MIDTHCHLTSAQFTERVADVIDDAALAGVHRMITVSTDGDDALAARELANIDDRVFFSSGIHPLHADGEWKWDYVRAAAQDARCVAWGDFPREPNFLNELRLKKSGPLPHASTVYK